MPPFPLGGGPLGGPGGGQRDHGTRIEAQFVLWRPRGRLASNS